MARNFVAASSQYLENGNAIVSVTPLTLAAWFNVSAANSGYLTIGHPSQGRRFGLGSNSGGNVYASAREAGVSSSANTTTTLSTGVWQHGCAVFVGDAERYAYLNGGGKGSNTATRVPSTMTHTIIGALTGTGPNNFTNGDIAEAAIWNVALTDAEVAILALGVSPLFVRPENLVAYWPLLGKYSPEIDLIGGFNMTLNAAPVAAAHVPILYPRQEYLTNKVSATGVTIAVPLKTFSLTKNTPIVGTSALVNNPSKAFSLNKFAPTVGVSTNIAVPSKVFSLSKFIPGVAAGAGIIVPLKTFTLTGFAPAIGPGINVVVPIKNFILNFNVPSINIGANVIVPLKAFNFNGNIPAVGTGVLIISPVKNFSLTKFVPAFSTININIVVPLKTFSLDKFLPGIHAVSPTIIAPNDLDLTPPFEDIAQTRYLYKNFDILRDILSQGATGQFTTADGKTAHVRNGIIVDLF